MAVQDLFPQVWTASIPVASNAAWRLWGVCNPFHPGFIALSPLFFLLNASKVFTDSVSTEFSFVFVICV